MALTVPGDRYAEFAREAARLGRWRPGTAGPETAAAISVVVTIVPAR
jgi:hypothetical protein